MPTTYHDLLQRDAVLKLAHLELIARLVVEGLMTGLHGSPYKGFNVEFAEHRQYMPGDEIRYIDWKAYAKTERYYIKQFEEDSNLKCYLAIDCSASMLYRGEQEAISKIAYCRLMAAAVAHLMLAQRDFVGLMTFNQDLCDYLPPRSSPSYLHQILMRLHDIECFGQTDFMKSIVGSFGSKISRRGLVIVFTDLMADPDTILRALAMLRHKKHEVIVFHVLDRNELELPFSDTCEFEDMETGQKLLFDTHRHGEAYRQKMAAFISDFKNRCGAHHINYRQITTDTPVADALFSYLKSRR